MAVGDACIYREATGLGVFGTSPTKQAWDTTVREDGIYSLSTTDVTVSEAGYYIVVYNVAGETQPAQTGRSNVTTALDIDGALPASGKAAGYFTRSLVNVCSPWSASVQKITASQVVSVKAAHVDTNTSNAPREQAALSGLQMVRIPDDWSVIRLSRSANESAASSTLRNVRFDTEEDDETSGDAFEWNEFSDPREVKLKKTGKHLVFYVVGGRVSGSKRATAICTLAAKTSGSGPWTEVARSKSHAYMTGDDGCTTGACVRAFIYDNAVANSRLKLQYRLESTGASTWIPEGDEIALSIVKIPDEAEVIRLGDVGGAETLASTGDFTWDTVAELDEGDQNSFTFTAPDDNATVVNTEDHLVLGSFFGSRTSDSTRVAFEGLPKIAGTLATYGAGVGYSRGEDAVDGDAYQAQCSFGGIYEVTATNTLHWTHTARGGADPNFLSEGAESGLDAINLASLFGGTVVVPSPAVFTFGTSQPSASPYTRTPSAAQFVLRAPDGTFPAIPIIPVKKPSVSFTFRAVAASISPLDTHLASPAAFTLRGVTPTRISGYYSADPAIFTLTPSGFTPLGPTAPGTSDPGTGSVTLGSGISRLTYWPERQSVAGSSAINTDVFLFGQAEGWEVLENPWDAVQEPGPLRFAGAEGYVPYADPNDAYIEVAGNQITFLSGPYAAGGINPVTRTDTNKDLTPWTGIANFNTIWNRHDDNTKFFRAFAEAAYWAGEVYGNKDARDAYGRLIVRVDGDLTGLWPASGSVILGAHRDPTSIEHVNWSSAHWWDIDLDDGGPGTAAGPTLPILTATDNSFAVLEHSARIKDLWFVGKNYGSPSASPRGKVLADRIGPITLADDETVYPNYGVESVYFQGLHIQNVSGLKRGVITGLGSEGDEQRFGVLGLWSCLIDGNTANGLWPDHAGSPTGTEHGLYFDHTRGFLHLRNIHFGRVSVGCIAFNYLNDGYTTSGEIRDPDSQGNPTLHPIELPKWNIQRSYFADLTMEYANGYMLALVNREEEAATEPSARGMVLIERVAAENCLGSVPTFIFTGITDAGEFVEDGTIILRDCSYQQGAESAVLGDAPLLRAKIEGGSEGAFFDSRGFGLSRIVIDGFKTLTQDGLSNIVPFTSGPAFDLSGVGEVHIWIDDATKWAVGNANADGIWRFDEGVSERHLSGNPNSNNPPFDTDTYPGGTRIQGQYFPYCGPVFFFRQAGSNVVGFAGWSFDTGQTANNHLVKVVGFQGGTNNVNTNLIDSMGVPPLALPGGATLLISGDPSNPLDASPGDISGTATSPYLPGLSSAAGNFPQNNIVGYLQAVNWQSMVPYGIRATHLLGGLDAMFFLETVSDGPSVANPAAFTFRVGAGFKLLHNEGFDADPAVFTFTADKASIQQSDLYNFTTGLGLHPLYDYSYPATKDCFVQSRSYQYKLPSGQILPATEEKPGGITVVLDANGHPDFNNIPPGAAGSTVVSVIDILQAPHHYPEGVYTIRWTGTGNIFMDGNFVVGVVDGTSPNFRSYDLDPSVAAIGIELDAGPVDNVQVFLPGFDPDVDADPSVPWLPRVKELIDDCLSPGAGRIRGWAGIGHCGQGVYGGAYPTRGTPTRLGWERPANSVWPHKDIGDPRQSEQPDQSLAGVATEAVISLCNYLERDWHCIVPHDYDDAQLVQFFTYIRDNLDGTLVAEFSNEMWNLSFPSHGYILWKYALTVSSANIAFRQGVAQEYDRMFQIGRAVYAAGGKSEKFIGYVAGHAADATYLRDILANMTQIVDEAGCACYVNVNQQAQNGDYGTSTTPSDIIDDLRANIPVTQGFLTAHRLVIDNHALAQGQSMRFHCYEGGQSIVPEADKTTDGSGNRNVTTWLGAAIAAQTHQDMFVFYQELQMALDAAGVDEVCWNFAWGAVNGPFGSFSHLYNIWEHNTGDGQSPKWDAIVRGTGSNDIIKKPPAAVFTFTAPAAAIDQILNPSPAPFTFRAPGAQRIPDPAAFTFLAPQADSFQGSSTFVPPPAVFTFRARAPQQAGNSVHPDAEGISYRIPEQTTGHGNDVLSVFVNENAPWPTGIARPVLIVPGSVAFAQSSPKSIIWEELHPMEFHWLSLGGVLVNPGLSGTTDGGVFDGFDTTGWDSLTSNPLPEKDAASIVKWTKQQVSAYGGDPTWVAWAGASTSGWVGAICLGAQRNFSTATSEQALESTELKALVWIGVGGGWVDAFVDTLPATHWPKVQDGTQAQFISQVSDAVLEKVSADSWAREAGFAGTTPVYLATAGTDLSTDLTRTDGGTGVGDDSDPALTNSLNWLVTSRPRWQTSILSQSLRNRADDVVHGTISVFTYDSSLGPPQAGQQTLYNRTFTGGINDPDLRVDAATWVFEVYSRREADAGVFTFRAPEALWLARQGADPAVFTFQAPEAAYVPEDTFAPPAARFTFQTPGIGGLAWGASSGVFAFRAVKATEQSSNDNVSASPAVFRFGATAALSNHTPLYPGGGNVEVPGARRVQIRRIP